MSRELERALESDGGVALGSIRELGAARKRAQERPRAELRLAGLGSLLGLSLAGLGVAIGVAGAFAVTRVIRSLLFNVDPLDVPTFAASALVLLLIAAVSSYLPARRALRVDPTTVMRTD